MRQRFVTSIGVTFIVLLLQIPSAPRTSEEVIPTIPDIGIQQIEAHDVEEKIGVPVLLRIPSIRVDAQIVSVNLTDTGKLDVPEHAGDVGWYVLGARPGQSGNAVLDGHLDIGKIRGVFWDLKHVRIGDVIDVTDDLGVVRSFRVRETAIYPVDSAPMQKIFGDADGVHLNLITCAGVWRKDLNHYDQRLIVFTDLIDTSTVHP